MLGQTSKSSIFMKCVRKVPLKNNLETWKYEQA